MTEYRTWKQIRRRLRHLTVAKRDAIYRFWNRRCAYCGKPASTLDHVNPVSRGGKNRHDNLLPACLPCNSAKGSMTLDEFAAVRGFDAAAIRAAVKLCAKRGTG